MALTKIPSELSSTTGIVDNSNATAITIDSSENVGIGTSSPSSTLEIAKNDQTNGATLSLTNLANGGGWDAGDIIGSIDFRTDDISTTQPIRGQIKLFEDSASGTTYANSNAMSFSTGLNNNLNERMRIDSSGNVGIGNSGPAGYGKFVVQGTGNLLNLNASSGKARAGFFENGTGRFYIDTLNGSDGLAFIDADGSTERMRIDASGNLNLADANIVNGGDRFIYSYKGGTSGQVRSGIKLDGTNTIQQFYTAQNERMRIDASGNLLVGKSSTSATTRGSYIDAQGRMFNAQPNGASPITFQTTSNGTTIGSISVTASATSYNTSSDYRLKENVVELTGATERLKQLNPSRFNFIADADTTVDGFLAHEVADVVPEAISGTKDAMKDEEYEVTPAVLDEEGNVVTEAVIGTRSVPEYQGIDQSKLVPLLVATIQELEARITELENN